MSELTESYERLLRDLEARGSAMRSFLNAGAPEEQVGEALRAAGAGAHPDLVELYAWHDGTDYDAPPGGPSLVPALDFLPLLVERPGRATSLSTYRFYLETASMPLDEGGWPPHWFPVFVFGPDVAVDTETGEVWLYAWPWYQENRFVAGSLAEFADGIVRDLASGRYVLDGRGIFSQHDLY